MMGFQLFESRFCTFEGPTEWRVVSGLGMVESDDQTLIRSAVVMENWVNPPKDASAYLQTQLPLLEEEQPETELLGEQRLDSHQLTEALLATFRTPIPNGGAMVQKQLVAVEGALVCTLTVSGLEDDRVLWDELCNPLLGSFTITADDWVGRIREADLVPIVEDHSPDGRFDLTGLGLSIPMPTGWEGDPTGTLRHGNEALISIRRSGLSAGSAEECFAEALQNLSQSDGPKPSAWQRGENPEGASFWAIDAITTLEKTFVSSGHVVHREVFIDDQGVISFTLDCVGESAGPIGDFSAIVAGYRWLEPEEQRLRLGEPWLPAELRGQWMPGGPGVYVGLNPPGTIVLVQQIGKEGELDEFVRPQIDAARRAPEIAETDAEKRDAGVLQGCDAVHYSLDFTGTDGETVCLRTCWFDTPTNRCVVNVRASSADTADRTIRTLLDSVKPVATTNAGDRGGAR